MSLGQIEEVIRETEGKCIAQKKDSLVSTLNNANDHCPTFSSAHSDSSSGAAVASGEVDSGSALQLFLDHIPISSIPGIRNSPVLELKTGDTLRDAINLLYEKNVAGAPIADAMDANAVTGGQRVKDPYIGYIDLARMVLWCLEKCEEDQDDCGIEGEGGGENGRCTDGIFSMLDQNPQIGQTKVGELAKSFLWDPFFPVNLDETLFHVLLLLSKHRLQVVPVVERLKSQSQVTGFVTQNAVLQLLLQSNGLQWFDKIANKTLAEFQLESEASVPQVCEDQTIAEAMHILYNTQLGAVAVINRRRRTLVGSLRTIDVHLLLDNKEFFKNRKSLTLDQLIRSDNPEVDSNPTIQRDLGALLSEGNLRLRNTFTPKMNSPVTNKENDTLKQAMINMVERNSNFSFLLNKLDQVTRVLTSRNIINQFAPPCMDSSIHGVDFFGSALEQTGCHVEGGTIVSN